MKNRHGFLLNALVALAVLTTGASGVNAASTDWLGVTEDWDASSNWSAGVPGGADQANFIQNKSLKDVALSRDATIRKLVYGNISHAYAISGTGVLTIDSRSTNGTSYLVNNEAFAVQTINNDVVFTNTKSGSNLQVAYGKKAGSGMTFGGSVTAASGKVLVLAGTEGSELTLHGDVINNGGIKFALSADGNAASVTIAGSGTAGGIGSLEFSEGVTVNLNRSSALSGSEIRAGGGTVIFGSDHPIASIATVTAEAGTSNSWETKGHDQVFGVLTLRTGASLAFDLQGTGGGTSLIFADCSATRWGADAVLSFVHVGTGDAIRFGTSGSALTAEQIGRITVNGKPAKLDANGYLTGDWK